MCARRAAFDESVCLNGLAIGTFIREYDTDAGAKIRRAATAAVEE
jgi:hypothetical protein